MLSNHNVWYLDLILNNNIPNTIEVVILTVYALVEYGMVELLSIVQTIDGGNTNSWLTPTCISLSLMPFFSVSCRPSSHNSAVSSRTWFWSIMWASQSSKVAIVTRRLCCTYSLYSYQRDFYMSTLDCLCRNWCCIFFTEHHHLFCDVKWFTTLRRISLCLRRRYIA